MAGQDDDGEKTVFGGQLPDPVDMREKLASLTPKAPVEPSDNDDTQPPQPLPDPDTLEDPDPTVPPRALQDTVDIAEPDADPQEINVSEPDRQILVDPFETQPPTDLPTFEDKSDPTNPPMRLDPPIEPFDDNERTIIGSPLPDLSSLEEPKPAPRPNVIAQPDEPQRPPTTPPVDDMERTVIGAVLPAPPAALRPRPDPNPVVTQQDDFDDDAERTIIGAALPLISENDPDPDPEPVTDDSPFAELEDNERTIIGERLPLPDPVAELVADVLPDPVPDAAPTAQVELNEDSTIVGAALPVHDEATILGAALPQVQLPPTAAVEQAPPTLEQMLQGPIPAPAVSANPLMASASKMLNLLGQLRNGAVDPDLSDLSIQLAQEVEAFEHNALAAKIDGTEAQIAKYILCGAADDIIQSLPGSNAMSWRQSSMVSRFFRDAGDSGIGVFQEAEKAMQAPRQRFNLLELFLCCLNLGFEGQYRHMENGAAQLTRIRGAIYEALRRVQPRRGADLSATWLPVIPGGKKRSRGMPLWGFFSIAAAVLVAFYSSVSYLIHEQGTQVAWAYRTVHPNDLIVELERTVPGPVFVAKTADQITRLQDRLVAEIDAGLVRIEEKGDFIILKAGENLRFEPGSASVNSGLVPVSGVLAKALDPEPGFVYVIGHSDALGSFTKNQLLSQARADAVADVLRSTFADPNRLTVLGRGESEPIADNATAEGRSLNRRVEILIEREDTN